MSRVQPTAQDRLKLEENHMSAPAYTRTGSGDPMVLLHGIGSWRHARDPVLPALAERFDVIAVDLPGFGDSDQLPAGADASPAAALATAVAGLLGEHTAPGGRTAAPDPGSPRRPRGTSGSARTGTARRPRDARWAQPAQGCRGPRPRTWRTRPRAPRRRRAPARRRRPGRAATRQCRAIRSATTAPALRPCQGRAP